MKSIAALQYPGRVKYNLEIVSGTGPSDWVVKLPQAPELISILGLSSAYYDASGVPLAITWATHVDNLKVRLGDKGGVIYSVDQDAATIIKIDKYIRNT